MCCVAKLHWAHTALCIGPTCCMTSCLDSVFQSYGKLRKGWVLWFQRVKDRFVLPTFRSECSGLLQGEDEANVRHLSLYSLASHQVLSLELSVGAD